MALLMWQQQLADDYAMTQHHASVCVCVCLSVCLLRCDYCMRDLRYLRYLCVFLLGGPCVPIALYMGVIRDFLRNEELNPESQSES